VRNERAEHYKEERDGESPAFHDHQALPDLRLVSARPDTTTSCPPRAASLLPPLPPRPTSQGEKWIENPSQPDRAESSSSASKTSPSTTCPGELGSSPADRRRPSTGHLLQKIPGPKEKTRRRPAYRALSPRGQPLQQVPAHPRSGPPPRQLIRHGKNGCRICASDDRVPCE